MENDEMIHEETTLDTENENDTLTEEEDVWEFVDDEAEEKEAETEENPEENPENEEPAENTEQEETSPEEMFPGEFEVDGQARAVTMAEAPSLIQKGLLYGQLKDKYMGKLKDAYADPRISFVDELAKAAGKTTAEFIAESQMRNKYSELIAEYGTLENVPSNVMKLFSENSLAAQKKIEAQQAASAKSQREMELSEEFESFMENHPEVREIPQEVIALKAKGESLEGAFAIVELAKANDKIAKLTQENKILEQNNKNKQTKLPSARSSAVKENDLWEFEVI